MHAVEIANGDSCALVPVRDELVIPYDFHSPSTSRGFVALQSPHRGGRGDFPGVDHCGCVNASAPVARSVEFTRRREYLGLAHEDFLAIDRAMTVQRHAAFRDVDIDHPDLGIDHVAGADRSEKL